MARKKSKEVAQQVSIYKEKVTIFQEKLAEVEELAQLAREEEKNQKDAAEEQIKSICEENEYFCGAILSRQDIINIVSLAMESSDSTIKIPFKLYFND